MKNIKVCTYTCRILSRRNFSGYYIILSTGWRRKGTNAIKSSTVTLLWKFGQDCTEFQVCLYKFQIYLHIYVNISLLF